MRDGKCEWEQSKQSVARLLETKFWWDYFSYEQKHAVKSVQVLSMHHTFDWVSKYPTKSVSSLEVHSSAY